MLNCFLYVELVRLSRGLRTIFAQPTNDDLLPEMGPFQLPVIPIAEPDNFAAPSVSPVSPASPASVASVAPAMAPAPVLRRRLRPVASPITPRQLEFSM